MSQKKEIINEEEALEGALSPIVNRLIDKNFENSGDKIASQMAPLIGGAIREQIKSQKDDVVDALYPVMGNMISKFVTKSLEELLNKINDQIQNGLSAKAIKRKIKAKLKGVSETELLLEESSEAKIKAALLIHKESGTLLAKAEDDGQSLSDADMLASMMTAIRSFVNDWVANSTNHQELGEIEYGGNKIIIEASGYSYLAIIVEGAAYTKTYEKIRSTLENIVLKYGDDIKKFQGNVESFPKSSVEEELQKLLIHKENNVEEKKSKSPLLMLLPLFLVAYLGYRFYNNYIDETLQKKIETRIENTPQLSPYRIDVNVEDKIATIKGRVPFVYHKKLLDKELSNIKELQTLNNEVQVTPTLTDPMQVSANIAYLIKGVNLSTKANISYDFDYNKLTLKGYVTDKKIKEKLLQELHKIEGISAIEDNVTIKIAPVSKTVFFDTASTKLNENNTKKLNAIIKYLKSDKNIVVTLNAYSDMIGDTATNRALAKKRIESIRRYLLEDANVQNKIIYSIFDTPPPGIDATKEPKKARAIILTLKQDKSDD